MMLWTRHAIDRRQLAKWRLLVLLSLATTALVLLVSFSPAIAEGPDNEQPVDFNDHIRPILSDRCYFCHGPDEEHREAGLRLDQRDAATEDLGSGAAIQPGDPDASLMISRILETDEDMVMPPPHSKRQGISEEEVALLRRWIAQGATYETHWAFAPLRDAPPPRGEAISSNPIDAFILDRLAKRKLTPSPPADRATLIRRVYLDLTGLLPEPSEVSAFENDTHPAAYEHLVDSLLASPHYAERWGRHWLDQARYADSNGYSIDSQRTMWPYRDWVIRAIADDMPFRQFTLEQLAGDLLPEATKEQRIASAFHRNTLINQEGGTDPEQFRHEAVVDRVNTTGAVWLGLTLGCAQCHTHKFDPISHREYYELFAFFNSGTDVNSTGATVPVRRGEALGFPESPTEQQRQQHQREREQELLQRLSEQEAQAEQASAIENWQRIAFRGSDADGEPIGQIDGDARFQPLEDHSLLVTGSPDPKTHYSVRIDHRLSADDPAPLQKIAAIKLKVLVHDSLPKRGPGLATNGNFVLTQFNLRVGDQTVRPQSAVADHQQGGYPVTAAIDGDAKTGWAINVDPDSKAVMNADHEATFVFDPAVEVSADTPIHVELHHQLNAGYLVGRLAIEVSQTAPAAPLPTADPQLIKALRRPADKRMAAEQKLVVDALRAAFPSDADQFKTLDSANVMVMADRVEPRPTYISIRGDFLRPDQQTGQLHPGGLSAVPPALPAAAGRNRIDLAKWLVAPENPLTPRVTVNRVWMRFFGRGLVETEEDFGAQGTPPTHPELLDYLARRFIDHDTSMKSLHRLIVTSSTYRQASLHRAELAEVDPRNQWLARQNRVRVEAEIVRDAALAASGALDRTIGGESVHPPQPDGVYSFTQNAKKWAADTGGDRFRRAMYTEFFRSAPHPLFATFDAPDFQTVCTRRARSNTPLQALTIANDEAFVELARAMAQRVLRERAGADTNERLEYAFRLALSRSPSSAELTALTEFHTSLLQSFSDDSSGEIAGLLGPKWPTETATAHRVGTDSTGGNAGSAQAAAMVAVCRAIFNVDNFITRE